MDEAIDHRISRIANRQQINITRAQLIALGLSDNGIRYRRRKGNLYLVHRAVYSVGRPPRTGPEKACAAVLACGDQAALAGEAAAAAWGFRKWPHPPYEVAAPTDRKHPGIKSHVVKLHPKDVRKHLGMRITSPARTALDLAARLPDHQLKRAVNDARLDPDIRLTLAQLADVIERYPRHPGVKRLKWFVEKGPRNPTRSGYEDEFPEFCDKYDIPQAAINDVVAGIEIDAYYESERLAVELDGWESHSGRAAFERDRERDATLLDEMHIPTLRITKERYEADPGREAARLKRILEHRRRELRDDAA
jgi:hypothetical protein